MHGIGLTGYLLGSIVVTNPKNMVNTKETDFEKVLIYLTEEDSSDILRRFEKLHEIQEESEEDNDV